MTEDFPVETFSLLSSCCSFSTIHIHFSVCQQRDVTSGLLGLSPETKAVAYIKGNSTNFTRGSVFTGLGENFRFGKKE